MTEDEIVEHVQEAVKAIRNPKRTIGMITGIATMVVAMGGALTYAMTMWTSYGWVTHGQYDQLVKQSDLKFEMRTEYAVDKAVSEQRNDRQDAEIKQQQQTSNEILAFVKIVPQIKVMIRIRCMGNDGVQYTIDDLKNQFRSLTGREYQEPTCNDPEIRGVR